ncbi:MAG: hypothetical protein RO469_10915 [Thermincola sp.]|jgi:hypothetical protein|nr:hypothetical protein [Thermincola sp.]MDT3702496.1 hypothetical protein [Thermincola sp.]
MVKKNNNNQGGNDMALLARPSDKLIIIKKSKTNKFLEDSRNNTIKPEFLARCQKFAKMMKETDK